ncbi:MAG TPA: AMIN domain-containing protein [Terriglobales bacterium]
MLSLGLALLWTSAYPQGAKATIDHVSIVGDAQSIAVQITASRRIAPVTQLLAGPDRFVIDFPGAVPGAHLQRLKANRGWIKGVRVGLFESSPPTTRVVIDLTTAGQYQIFPFGNTILVKLEGGPVVAPAPAIVTASTHVTVVPAGSAQVVVDSRTPIVAEVISGHATITPLPPSPAPKPQPKVRVSFQRGQLSITADKATLADVLYEVHMRTGADIPIPSGAEQEKVVVNAGPGPAKDVMATLLNGTSFNFVVVGSESDSNALKSVILTPKEGSTAPIPVSSAPSPQPPLQVPAEVPDVDDGQQQQMPPPSEPPAPPMQPDENTPPQADPPPH